MTPGRSSLGRSPLRRWLALGLSLALLALPAVAWAAPILQEGHGEGGGGGSNFAGLIVLIILFPVIGLLINAAFGRHLGEKWVGVVASGAAGLAFLIAVLQLFTLRANGYAPITVPLADWINIGDPSAGSGQALHVPWAFQIDTLSVTMMLVVTGVGTLIHIYAIGYMHEDVRVNGDPGRFPRFFVYLNLFLAAMLILVTGDNYLMMFVGWEGVGLCSYLLIGFWFEKGEGRIGNARAGRKAFVANRVGDWAMLLAMFMIFWTFGSLTFNEVFERTQTVRLTEFTITAITLLLLVGATGKSAQVPLYVWLPDAMAGPTPVSALIHAATMVTAGIYMITRSSALFALAPISQTAVALIGGITALFAATIALGQFDIKRVLAYSTISQLGFMVAAVGLGAYVAGMFHLITHAFFKALLFLSAGSVIHAMEHGHHATHGGHGAGHGAAPEPHGAPESHGASHPAGHGPAAHEDPAAHGQAADPHAPAAGHAEGPKEAHGAETFDPQDMRNMGGLWQRLPVTKWVYLIGALALAGIPPLAGFWSKDEILLDASLHNTVVYVLLTIAAFFTAFYMGRQLLMVFFQRPRTEAARHAGESPPVMTIPLIALAVLSVFGGALNLPSILGYSPPGAHALSDWLGHTLEAHPAGEGDSHGAADESHGAADTHAAEGEHSAAAEGGPGTLNLAVAGLSTGLAVAALGLSYALYRRRPETADERDPLAGLTGPIFTWLRDKWYIDELYDLLILRPYSWLAKFSADVVDWRFWHDWFHDRVLAGLFNTFSRLLADGVDLGFIDAMANGLADLSRAVARGFRRVQTGYVRSYALAVFLGVVVVLGYFLLAR